MGLPHSRRRVLAFATVLLLTVFGSVACTGSDEAPAPFPGGGVDYQLGGAYAPAPAVAIVGRDRGEVPAPGTFSICYVNGFQTQPGERGLWPQAALLVREGEPVIDPDWPDEQLLDTASSASRSAILEIVAPWIRGCADAGFAAVEFDNLDSFSRSAGLLDFDDNLALAREYVRVAHDVGLLAGQKNAAEHAQRVRDDAGFDFAVVEECAAYDECRLYERVYGSAVVDIEYTDNLPMPFPELCRREGAPESMVLRDRDLTTPGNPEYVFELCP